MAKLLKIVELMSYELFDRKRRKWGQKLLKVKKTIEISFQECIIFFLLQKQSEGIRKEEHNFSSAN